MGVVEVVDECGGAHPLRVLPGLFWANCVDPPSMCFKSGVDDGSSVVVRWPPF